jgi:hypothetical protein
MNKKTLLIIGVAAAVLATVNLQAQVTTVTSTNGTSTTTTNTATPPAQFLSGGLGGLGADVNQLWGAVENSGVLQATNWAVAPYATYAPSAKDKVGGGIMAIYDVPALTSTNLGAVGLCLGMDWLGSWSLVSGSATVQANTHPLANISWLSWLPAPVRNAQCTPFALAGIGQPLTGGSAGAATLWDLGYEVKFGHWLGGQFGTGVTWGEWIHAGSESGHRYHFFLSYQYGF